MNWIKAHPIAETDFDVYYANFRLSQDYDNIEPENRTRTHFRHLMQECGYVEHKVWILQESSNDKSSNEKSSDEKSPKFQEHINWINTFESSGEFGCVQFYKRYCSKFGSKALSS